MAAFSDVAFSTNAFSTDAFDFGVSIPPPPPPPTGSEGGISGYLKREKGYSRLGGNVMVQTMGEATERAEKIMVGWRDEEEAMMLVQIIETFYD